MKKKIVAFIGVVALIFSALTLTACNPTVKTMSAKEIFELSFKDTFSFENLEAITPEPTDFKSSFVLNIDKLAIGENIIADAENPISLGMSSDFDSATSAVAYSVFLDILGEKPSASAVITQSAVYIVDLLGLNDSAISIDIPELEADSSLSSAVSIYSSIDFSKLSSELLTAFSNAFKKNITDDHFSKEITDITVEEVQYKGAAVVTLTLDKDTLTAICVDIANSIKNSDSLKDLIEDSDDITASDIDLGEVDKIIITDTVTADSKTLSMNFDVNDKDGTNLFYFTSAFSDNSVKISAGQPTPFFNLSYSWDENGAQSFSCNMNLDEDVNDGQGLDFKFDETFKDGKFEGTASIEAEGTTIGLKYSREEKKDSSKFSTSELFLTSEGITISLPAEFTLEQKTSENETKTDLSFKMNLQDTLDISISSSFSVKNEDVSISTPENSVNIEEISEDTLNSWLLELPTKYPTIYLTLSSLFGMEM